MALGSPGGSRIIPYVAKTLIAMIDWRLGPRPLSIFHTLLTDRTFLSSKSATPATALQPYLERLGYETKVIDMNSGLPVIAITPELLIAGVDRRRAGIAAGD
jgi:gamma-glutamyltranspeptidase / glutathione hydrolase